VVVEAENPKVLAAQDRGVHIMRRAEKTGG
jgi:hypothetical protein